MIGQGNVFGTCGLEMLEPRLLLSAWYVDESADPGGDGSEGSPFLTIQQGLSAAAHGDVVHVAAGLYAENITIDKALALQADGDATIRGAAPGPVVVISHAGSEAVADTVVLDGFIIEPPAGAAAGDWPIQVLAGSAYVTVSNNVLDASRTVSQAISLSGAYDTIILTDNTILYNNTGINFNPESTAPGDGPVNVRIEGNTLSSTAEAAVQGAVGVKIGHAGAVTVVNNVWEAPLHVPNDPDVNATRALVADDVTGLEFIGNIISGYGADSYSYGILLQDVSASPEMSGNIFADLRYAVEATQGLRGLGTAELLIGGADPADGNTFTDNRVGVIVYDSGDGAIRDVAVQGNAFTGNGVGIQVGHPSLSPSDDIAAGEYLVMDNVFDLTNDVALWNYETDPVTDTITPGANWWGHYTGARHPSNPKGRGALVQGLADLSAGNINDRPAPDLTAAIDSARVRLNSTIVPGDKGRVGVRITNIGDATAAGPIIVGVYLSADRTLDDLDPLIGLAYSRIRLAPGQTKTTNVAVKIGAGFEHNFLIAQADNGNTFDNEFSKTNNVTVSDTAYDLVYQFGNVPGRPGRTTLTLSNPHDLDVGLPDVTFSLTGRGLGEVSFVWDRSANPALICHDVSLTGVGPGTIVTVKTLWGREFALRNITADGGMRGFLAPPIELTGTLNVPGALGNLTLGHVANGSATILGALGNLMVQQWDAGSITVDTLANLRVTGSNAGNGPGALPGDFGADLTVNNFAGRTTALNTAFIAGSLTNSTVRVGGAVANWTVGAWMQGSGIYTRGNLNAFTAGGMTGSTVLAGSNATWDGFAANTTAVLANAKITGTVFEADGNNRYSFLNSFLAAARVNNARIANVQPTNTGNSPTTEDLFGVFVTENIGTVLAKTGAPGAKFQKWTGATNPNDVAISPHFAILVV